MNYWEECITEALDDSGLKATKEQIENIASWVEGAHENYGLATGLDVVVMNHKTDAEIELEKLKKSIADKEEWESSTSPCKSCNTTGTVKDGWGRDLVCQNCDGKGRK